MDIMAKAEDLLIILSRINNKQPGDYLKSEEIQIALKENEIINSSEKEVRYLLNDVLLEMYASLFCHKHHLFKSIGRWSAVLVFRFRYKLHGFRWTNRHAQAASDTPIQVDCHQVVIIHLQSTHLASLQTDFAAGACVVVRLGVVIGKNHFRRFGMSVERNKDTTAILAAVAHAPRIL